MRGKASLKRTLALFAVAGLVLGACGSDDDNDTAGNTGTGGEGGGESYAIAYVGPLTGDAGNLGVNIRNGVKLAVDQHNESGDGPKIVLKEFDTQGDPAQAPTVAAKYINDESILGIAGPAFSGETKAVLPTLEQEGLVMVSPSATNVQLPEVVPNGKVFHRVLADDDAQAAGIAKYLKEQLKPAKLAIVHDNSEYGKGLAIDQLAAQLKGGNVEVALTEAVDPKSQDFSAAVNKVKSSGADAIFYGGYYQEAGRLKKQLSDAGYTGTFISGDGSLDNGFIEAAGAQADGAQLSCPCNLATPDSEGALGEFATAYQEAFGSPPATYSAEGFDAAKILIEGIKAGNTTREKLLEYVEGLESYDGISKPIEFTEEGNIKAQGVFLFEVKDRKIVPLLATDDI